MLGCRHNAKNTLPKNYLFFAEKWGAQIRAEAEVRDIRPLGPGQADGSRYEVIYGRPTAWPFHPQQCVRTANVIVAAGALGTLRLLFRCREVTGSLPRISPRLGEGVRTNSESFLGVTVRDLNTDYSEGIAVTSLFQADANTTIEPVRYPDGSSLMRFFSAPLLDSGRIPQRLLKFIKELFRHPLDFLKTHLLPGWARRTTIILVMRKEDSRLRLRLGRKLFPLFRRDLVSQSHAGVPLPARLEVGYRVTKAFAAKTNGIPAATVNEVLWDEVDPVFLDTVLGDNQ
jgi:cholesterol oxidase